MKPSVVVIGSGPVGIRAIEDLSALDSEIKISVYGDEPCQPYNRVLLSNYLAGQADFETIRLTPNIQEKTELTTHYGHSVASIDPVNKCITTVEGEVEYYDKLVLATGSHAHIPSIQNTDLEGVYTLRTVADADALRDRESKTTVVLGGGLLGLETARALQTQSQGQVIVVDHSPSLMSRQLNKEAGDVLLQKVLDFGLKVELANGVKDILGEDKLEAVVLRDGQKIECDTLVMAVGIRPNIELAKESGIHTRHGIVVDEKLMSSANDVYAVGECAEFNNLTYGIVAPGFEQARIMAENICGKKAKYSGSVLSTRLKVLDFPVFSMGRVGENEAGQPDDRIEYFDKENNIYRYIVVYRGKLIGCIGLGEWTELSRIRTAIEENKRLWPWHIKRFKTTGLLWADAAADSVVFWPDSAIVCNCTQVSRGQLGQAVRDGCKTVSELTTSTSAGTTCGSCSTLLSELLGAQVEPVSLFKTLAFFSVIALLAGMLTIFLPGLPFQQMATIEWFYDELWRDNYIKQVTGYVLLGCSVVVSTLSLRKRIKKFSAGNFAGWRIMHVSIGFITLAVLLAHTGFRFGNNFNSWLMVSFTGLLVLGALAGVVISSEHKMNPGLARSLRSQMVWGHILLFWPLPILLGFHILQTYYF